MLASLKIAWSRRRRSLPLSLRVKLWGVGRVEFFLCATPSRVIPSNQNRVRVCMCRPCIWGVGRVQFPILSLCNTCNVGGAALDQAGAVITKQTKTVCVCVCVGRPIRPPSHAGTMRKPSLQCRWIYTRMSVGFTQVDLHKYLSPQKARLEGV